MSLNIVLLEPEIPANTGNIGRTCLATGTSLHLIEPLGFQLNERALKRAGLDYWHDLDVTRYDDWSDFIKKNPTADLIFSTTKAKQTYCDIKYEKGAFLVNSSPMVIILATQKKIISKPVTRVVVG